MIAGVVVGNKKRPCIDCEAEVAGRRCRDFAIRRVTIQAWRASGKLKDVEAGALLTTAVRRAPRLCRTHAIKYLVSIYGPDVRQRLVGDTLKGRNCFDLNRPGVGRRCVASPCRARALAPRTVERHRREGQPLKHGYCIAHALQMVRQWHRHHGRAPLLRGKLWWQDLPGLQHARQCTAKVKEGYRWRQCKRPASRGFWVTEKSGKQKFQPLKRAVCSAHGAKGACLGYLSRVTRRSQTERDRLVHEQRLETKRRQAALKERVADGALVGVRRPQPVPASQTPLGDEFFRGRAERPESLPALYPGCSRK